MHKLSDQDIDERLGDLPGWQVRDSVLHKDFTFDDFIMAMDFMARLVPAADKLNHHPDWSNSYNKVAISLTTHDAGGLTENDFVFAQAAEQVAGTLIADEV